MKSTNRILFFTYGDTCAVTLNRAAETSDKFTLPADGWFQIGKVGEMNKELEMPGGKKVVVRQKVTADDLAVIANRFKDWAAEPGFDGLLVDFDHESADKTKSTRAAAWIMNAERRNGDELWGNLRLTGSGRAGLESGDFRHFSPVLGFEPRDYRQGDEAHPAALLGGAFTNQPTFKGMLPLANREDPNLPPPDTMNKTLVLQLLAALGSTLAADAAPEAIDAALTSAIEKAKGAGAEMAATKNRLVTLESEQITRDLDAYKLTGAARETWKGALTKNREEGLSLLKATFGEPVQGAAYARTHNRSGASTPDAAAAESAEKLDAERDTAVREYQTRNRCDFQTAWDAVKGDSSKAHLFASTR